MLLREIFEAQAKQIVAVMPGGFHPFHPGHKSLYDWAVKTFGKDNVYVAATNDTATRPFPFEVKKQLAAMAGVPKDRVIQVKSPFNAMSYKDIVDDNTALVFVRSQKDKNEQPLPDQIKKNGEPGYLRTYTGKDLEPSNVAGYMAYGPTIDFDFSGMQIKSASELRNTWPNMADEDKLKAAKLMYGNGAEVAVKLLDQALGVKEPEVAEGMFGIDAKPMYDAVRSGMGIAESTYSQRMLKVIETLSDLNRINPFNQETNTYILEQVSIIKEHLSFQKKDKDLSEAYSPEIDDKWIEREIRATAKKHGIDPNVAVRVWRSEGGSSKNYQSKIKRSGKGSVGGQEASYGPYQLYTGGGLGNEYQEKYGVDLSADNSPEGLQRQIDFALGKAKQVGWKPWYGAAKAGIGDRDGIDGTQYADAGNIATDASVDNSGPSDFGAAFASARKKHGGAGGKFTYRGKEYQTNVKGEKYVTNPVSVDEATLDLPDLETGDELMVGKFKNRKATIKDFKKDEHGQPVAVTNKGDQKIFKGRVKKLMPTEGESPHKKGTEKYRKHMAAMHASAEPKGTMIEGVSYADPQFDVEWEEANRYPYLEKLGPEGWKELAKTGRAVRVTTDSVKKIGNTGADGSESLDDLEPEKVARLKQAMDSGTVEMPIVVKQPDGSLELIAGNTRLIGLISTQGEAQVWLVDASTLTEGVGRIVKGVNTTPDVGVNQTKIEAAKLGSKVDKDGRPPLLHKKAAKNSDTNTLFNLGLAEGKLSENNKSHAVVIKFVNHCKDKLELPNIPTITLVDRIGGKTFGQYNTVKKDIAVQLADRHIVDVLRTLAHELVHHKQRHLHSNLDGSDGSDHENQANALAGKLMRQFGKRYPKLYEGLQERASIGVPLSSGLTVNIAPHRELKIKKSTKGRHNYENPRTKKSRKSK